MRPLVLVLLIIILLFFIQLKIIGLIYGLEALIIAYFLSYFILSFFKTMGFLKQGAINTVNSELEEMEKANPKSPSGKEFFEKGFSRIGKGLGKAEKARMEKKKIIEKRGTFQKIGDSADDFITGVLKLFK